MKSQHNKKNYILWRQQPCWNWMISLHNCHLKWSPVTGEWKSDHFYGSLKTPMAPNSLRIKGKLPAVDHEIYGFLPFCLWNNQFLSAMLTSATRISPSIQVKEHVCSDLSAFLWTIPTSLPRMVYVRCPSDQSPAPSFQAVLFFFKGYLCNLQFST